MTLGELGAWDVMIGARPRNKDLREPSGQWHLLRSQTRPSFELHLCLAERHQAPHCSNKAGLEREKLLLLLHSTP